MHVIIIYRSIMMHGKGNLTHNHESLKEVGSCMHARIVLIARTLMKSSSSDSYIDIVIILILKFVGSFDQEHDI